MFNDFIGDGFLGCLLGGGGLGPQEEYLTIEETAALLKLSSKTIRNKMTGGELRLGEHYFRPPGMGPRFKRSALVAWLEQPSGCRAGPAAIAPKGRRGFVLGN